MEEVIKRPGVGLAIILINDEEKIQRLLLLKRRGSHGAGTWSFPGGHLEKFETFSNCIEREMIEETGLLRDKNYLLMEKQPCKITNDFFHYEDKHYVTLYFRALHIGGEPVNNEPEKCEKLGWFRWGEFPSELFLPVQNLIKEGYNPLRD